MFQYTQSCLEPVFALRLKEFDLNQVAIGGIYTITPLMFIVGNILIQPLKKKFDRRIIMIIGCILNAIAGILIGPSERFGLPQKLGILCSGSAFLGVGCACTFPNALPEICTQVNAVFKLNKEFNNNFAAGIFRLMQGFG
jgi:MFS family permease